MLSAHKRLRRPSHCDVAAQTRSRNYALCITSGIIVLAALLMSLPRQPQRVLLPAAAAGPMVMSMRLESVEIRIESSEHPVERRIMADDSPFTAALPPQPEPEKPREEPKPEEKPKVVEQKPKVQPPVAKPEPRKIAAQKAQPIEQKNAVPGPRQQVGHPEGSPDGGVAGGVLGGVPGGKAGGVAGGVTGGVSASSKNTALSKILNAVEKNKNYPKHARRSGAEGLVILLVSINDQGRITASSLDKHCGQAALDNATKELGEKLIGLNTGVQGAAFSVRVPVEYKLK